MDWKALFLTSQGRIGQKDFWIGFAILFVGGFVLGLIPLVNMISGFVLIYPTVCIFAKRLHDFGKSGWLAATPYAIGLLGVVLMMMVGGGAMFASMMGDSAAAAGAMGAMGAIGLIAVLLFVAYIGFVLWVGLSKGDPGANAYGPPPIANTGDLFA